jgi:predicted Kef-type K+ transport protein
VLDLVQWPAMLVTVMAAWLVGSTHAARRKAGFWVFLLSNLLWVIWGIGAGAIALVLLQFALAAMNTRGMIKNQRNERERLARQGAVASTLPTQTPG